MAPQRGNEFRFETYQRLVTITKARFDTIKKSVETLTNQADALTRVQEKTLSTYLIEVQKKKDDFEENCQRVINLPSDSDQLDLNSLIHDQDHINEAYTYIVSHIESLTTIDTNTTNLPDDTDVATSLHNGAQVRLPKINLPKFTGDLSMWSSFINLYDATIHNNASLTNVTRFQYLLGTLEREPLNLIRSLSITAANYDIAYRLLRERYQNDRRLQILHLNQLLDLPNISSSNMDGVRQFVNVFNENTQALTALGYDVQDSNLLLVAVLLRKMDIGLRHKLETFREPNSTSKHVLPTSKVIIEFLTNECNHLEDAMSSQRTYTTDHQMSSNRVKQNNHLGKPIIPRKNVTMTVTPTSSLPNSHSKLVFPCFACNKSDHKIYSCPTFQSQTPNERFQTVKQHRKCVSCLGAHDSKTCQSLSTCKKCSKRHHTLLHFDNTKSELTFHQSNVLNKDTPNFDMNANAKPAGNSVSLLSQNQHVASNNNTTVLLGTLLVQVMSICGGSHVFRALIDSGSMCNLITEHAASLLKLKRHKSSIQLSGIEQQITRNKGQIFIDLKTLSGQTVVEQQPALVLDKLTLDLPRTPISYDILQLTHKYNLADPTFHVPGRIDLILGGALFPQIITQDQFSFGPNLPHALGTQFGYILMGTAPCQTVNSEEVVSKPVSSLNLCLHTITDADLHSSIQRFWVQEELPKRSIRSNEETLCDNHFAETHSRDEHGRYVLRLPFKEPGSQLGESRRPAENRLFAMERKFNSNATFSNLYHDFMAEYENLGHMSPLSNFESSQSHFFLPHHGVIKEGSSTTKLRTVFDASCKTSTGISLNDILLTGPKLQNNICDLLLQFRRHNIVFCCDIKQMYRQISIHPDDRQFQLILWRSNPKLPIDVYQLNTVTYGMNSSPYLAIRTLHQLADDEGENCPAAAHVLRHHTYVDDIITGADTLEEAACLQSQLIDLLKRGGFELRKWVSNAPELLNTLPETHLEVPKFLQNSDLPHFTVLGLQWTPSSDSFTYNFHKISSDTTPTKRTVLSTIAQIFDPCGFLVPFIMLAKCFMQLLWTKGLSWDTPLSTELQIQWKTFIDDMSYLSQITIPRSLNLFSTCKIELHGFCDASEIGFASVTYVRCETSDASTCTQLLMAKSRVAPLKRVTIPRLELCAAHLLANLISHIQSLFPTLFHAHNTTLWSDSTIALTWLKTPPYRLKTYVANRVSQIQELIPADSWKHISSEHNPADCASRGLRLMSLINHKSWWNGPEWLSQSSTNWPSSIHNPVELNSSHELKPNPLPVFVNTTQSEWLLLTKFSSWDKLQRVTAYVLRFVYNCRNKTRRSDYLSTQELNEARTKLFSIVQRNTMSNEFTLLSDQQPCSKHIQRLKPFIDSESLIRVGGRICNASIAYNSRHPVLLPKHHHVVNLLIDHFHIRYLHAGLQMVQSMLTQQVWILNARNIIRSRLFKCVKCYKHRPKAITPLMGDLPACRINPARAFTSTGMDFGGPYSIKITNLRFIKHIKVYICIFVCMVVKAVHIEVVHDLTTSAFIAALMRFTSRRGLCNHIYSDCGTNFIGANNELKKIIHGAVTNQTAQKSIQHFASQQEITFHFNPPAAPHHGGLWESAIKNAKYYLQRVIGSSILTFPEFTTLTTRVEGMLNSRPLTPLSSDPSDLTALTPGHFLIGAPLFSVPEHNLTNIPLNRLKHWQLSQAFFQTIWKRWKTEYLHSLQQRMKWTTTSRNLKVGDLVLINMPSTPLQWPLARVTKVFPGQDGIIRVAEVRTDNNSFIRPVTKLCALPLD